MDGDTESNSSDLTDAIGLNDSDDVVDASIDVAADATDARFDASDPADVPDQPEVDADLDDLDSSPVVDSDELPDANSDLVRDGSNDLDTDATATPPGFVDVTELWGLGAATGYTNSAMTGGVALVDLDGAFGLDIVVAGDSAPAMLFLNTGSGFVDATAGSGLQDLNGTSSVNFGDVDGDGDPDLYFGGVSASHLFINQTETQLAPVFVDQSETWGVGSNVINASSAFADFDQDGDLDLFESGYSTDLTPVLPQGEPNTLYRNVGGQFEATLGPGSADGEVGPTLSALWTDVDADGWLDLWLVNDFGNLVRPNQVYRNLGPETGWQFEERGASWGWDHAVFGMGAALGDVDNDGDLDGYVCNAANNLLLIRDGTEVFDRADEYVVTAGHFPDPLPEPPGSATWNVFDPESESSLERGMARFCADYCDPGPTHWALTSWGGVYLDADQDGWLDLFVANGSVGLGAGILPEGVGQPNQLFLNRGGAGESRFERLDDDIFPRLRGATRGSAAGDLDSDGDLDLVWTDGGYEGPGRLVVLENQMASGNWLIVHLQATQTAGEAIGARVQLNDGERRWIRQIAGGGGYLSADQRDPHFGLGDTDEVEVTVFWPGGRVSVIDEVSVNQVLSLVEPEE